MSTDSRMTSVMQLRMMIMSMPQNDAQEVMVIYRAIHALIASNPKAGDIALTLAMLEHADKKGA